MKYKILLAVIAIVGIAGLFLINHSLIKEKDRLRQNQETLLSKIDFYKKDSLYSAASINQLRLTKEELEESNLSLQQEVEALNIKLKRLNSASVVGTKSEYKIKTVVKDSIIYRDSIIYVSQCLDYTTPYLFVNGCIIDSSTFEGTIITKDSLVRVEHRVPKKFLFFKFGTKLVKEEYLSKNPHTTLTHVETVVIVDKNGKRKDR